MFLRQKIKFIKTILFDLIQNYFDSIVWDEFSPLLTAEESGLRLPEIQGVLIPPSTFENIIHLILEYEGIDRQFNYLDPDLWLENGLLDYGDELAGMNWEDICRWQNNLIYQKRKYVLREWLEGFDIQAHVKITTLINDYLGAEYERDEDNHYITAACDLTIRPDDFPAVRDLKAFYNVLQGIERIFNGSFNIPIMLALSRNFKICMATNSIITHKIEDAKTYVVKVIWPQVTIKFYQLYQLMTVANLKYMTDSFIHLMIKLDLLQLNLILEKQKKMRGLLTETKSDAQDGFIAKIIKDSDYYLRKLYKDNYNLYFLSDAKSEKQLALDEYYPENKSDKDTIKNIKIFLNAIKAMQKVLNDYEGYQSSRLGLTWGVTFFWDLASVYSNFKVFDHEAILAEQALPLANFVKSCVSALQPFFEKMACMADEVEWDQCLKENSLLNQIELLLERYSQITYELQIPINYVTQKGMFFKSRMKVRERYLNDIDEQIQTINHILPHRNRSHTDMSREVKAIIYAFIQKYDDSLCMDRDHLKQYQLSLEAPIIPLTSFWNNLEKAKHFCGMTVQSEFMQMLDVRKKYLSRQKVFLQDKYKKSLTLFESKPMSQEDILKAIKNRSAELHHDKLTVLKEINNGLGKVESSPGDEKSKPIEIQERLTNQLAAIAFEQSMFRQAAKEYEAKKDFQTIREQAILEVSQHNGFLSKQSLLLLDEIQEASCNKIAL